MKPTLAILLSTITEPASANELEDLLKALEGPTSPPATRATAPPPPPRIPTLAPVAQPIEVENRAPLEPEVAPEVAPLPPQVEELVTSSACDFTALEAEVVALRARLAQLEASVEAPTGAISAPHALHLDEDALAYDERGEPTEEVGDEGPWGVELTYASAYVDAGENVFAEGSPWNSHAAVLPAVAWTHRTTGLTIGYDGVFQADGANAADLIAEGVGHQQAIYAGLERSVFSERLEVGVELKTTFFPFADPKQTDVVSPAALEGGVSLTWEGPATIAVAIAYENGLQQQLWGEHKLTVEPSITHELPLSHQVTAAFGTYLAVSNAEGVEVDGGVDLGVGLALVDGLELLPSAHLAWSRGAEAREAHETTFLWWDLVVGTRF